MQSGAAIDTIAYKKCRECRLTGIAIREIVSELWASEGFYLS
jgi:hypothetical protein